MHQILSTFHFLTWEELIPEIRAMLGVNVMGMPVEESHPMSIFQKDDITGDGIPEALVNLGSGGASTEALVLMRMEQGKPIVAIPLIFYEGATVRHGSRVAMIHEENLIYQGTWSIDDTGKLDSCNVTAYRWNAKTKTFDLDTVYSKSIKPGFCSGIVEKGQE